MRKIFLIGYILTLTFLKVHAQSIPMPYTMSTPYGNVQVARDIYIPQFYFQQGALSPYCDYSIKLNNDSVINKKTKIVIKDDVHYFHLKVNGQKRMIVPRDTKALSCNYYGENFTAIPADSCWLFKSESGRINTYSFIPGKSSEYIIAIQKGNDSEIKKLNQSTLIEMVGDNKEALKFAEKEKLIKAIRIYNK